MAEGENLKSLGSNKTEYIFENEKKADVLESFENKFPGREYFVEFHTTEFTSLCPKTGQPDFATLAIRYVPKDKCVETKSLKLYLFTFRNEGSFMETITNRILDDLVKVIEPQLMEIVATFNTRGGIKLTVRAGYTDKPVNPPAMGNYQPQECR